MNRYLLCVVTIDNLEIASLIAKSVLGKRLASGVNILPGIKSLYWWKGLIQEKEEAIMLFQTRNDLYNDFEIAVKELHPYEVPEIIAINVDHGLDDYLKWIHDSTIRQD
jgi:periplasmic divalent cation tolerance protein